MTFLKFAKTGPAFYNPTLVYRRYHSLGSSAISLVAFATNIADPLLTVLDASSPDQPKSERDGKTR